MAPDDLFPDFTGEPVERPDLPVWTHRPQYAQPEMGTAKEVERWHGHSAICAVCGQEIVPAHNTAGEYLELCVRARTWRIRLDAAKSGYTAERGSAYPEHTCPKEERADAHDP